MPERPTNLEPIVYSITKAKASRCEKLVQYFTTTSDWTNGIRRDRLLVNSKEIVALAGRAKSV